MKPISPVIPGSEPFEVLLGKDQPEYTPLPAFYVDTEGFPVLTRWEPSEEERARIMAGADIVFTQLTFRQPFQPVHLQVCMRFENPLLVSMEEDCR